MHRGGRGSGRQPLDKYKYNFDLNDNHTYNICYYKLLLHVAPIGPYWIPIGFLWLPIGSAIWTSFHGKILSSIGGTPQVVHPYP